MTLQQLRDLVAVVSHGGYRAAARALDVSQAGLTKSLAHLEQECGVALLERTAKGILLSAAGEDFLVHARSVLEEANRAEEWLQGLTRTTATQVKVGVSIDPSLLLAPAVLSDFRAACPDATIHLTQRSSSELFNAIRDNRLELAVTRLPKELESTDLTTHVLYKSTAAILARREHPLRHVRSVQDLAESEWIVVGDPGRPGLQDDSIRDLFLQHRLGRPRLAAVSDSLFGVMSMLLESDCVARLPAAMLRHPLAAGKVVEIKVHEQLDLAYDVGIVYKAGRRLGREATQLVAMLRSYARLTSALGSAQAPRPQTAERSSSVSRA